MAAATSGGLGDDVTVVDHIRWLAFLGHAHVPPRRILVSSSGTHSVRSDRVAPYSLRIFRGL